MRELRTSILNEATNIVNTVDNIDEQITALLAYINQQPEEQILIQDLLQSYARTTIEQKRAECRRHMTAAPPDHASNRSRRTGAIQLATAGTHTRMLINMPMSNNKRLGECTKLDVSYEAQQSRVRAAGHVKMALFYESISSLLPDNETTVRDQMTNQKLQELMIRATWDSGASEVIDPEAA